MTLVKKTRIIHITALSIPRDLASRATQISKAMSSAIMTMGMTKMDPQTPQPPAAAQAFGPSDCCARTGPAISKSINGVKRNFLD